MRQLRLLLFTSLLCQAAHAAALVRLLSSNAPAPSPGLEPNRGQLRSGVLFTARGSSVAVSSQSIEFAPLGVRQEFVSSRPNTTATFTGQLPGLVNSYTGTDPRQWITGIPRYTAARITGVYEGVDAVYTIGNTGQFSLKLQLAAGVDPQLIAFEIKTAVNWTVNPAGDLRVQLGPNFRFDPALSYSTPRASQGEMARTVRYDVRFPTQFGFQVDGWDSTKPLEIEIEIVQAGRLPDTPTKTVMGTDGSLFTVVTTRDAAGKDDPFPGHPWAGCGVSLAFPITCSDVAVYKFSSAGTLLFATYLSGRTSEVASFAKLAPGGSLVIAGSTDSSDFPVSTAALQPAYAGPPAPFQLNSPPTVMGDFFAVRVDSATGLLQSSTYLGGPNADEMGTADFGADGSLYFLPKWLGTTSTWMPTSRGALMSSCPLDGCPYAARLSPNLDRLLYGTYLPGSAGATAQLHSDGSVYYAGAAEAGFPTTPTAYQRTPVGGYDATVARLDPTGTNLMFATYYGTPKMDHILRMAVAPDGSVWVHVSSFVECCVNIDYTLLRFDAKGEKVLVSKPIDIGDIATDPQGNLIATAYTPLTPSANAFQLHSCGAGAYLKLSPNGDQLFASFLPYHVPYDFAGKGDNGLPILSYNGGLYQVSESVNAGVFTGCVVDAAGFGNADRVSPGGVVTLFGSQMGPKNGVPFQLQDGRLPTSLGGTSVFVNGDAIPLLYVSEGQINAILPYTLPTNDARPEIQVVTSAGPGNVLTSARTQRAGISLFRIGDRTLPSAAAALNEDGTVNSATNPAAKGSRVVLFGTGGGATNPPSVAGEVTPLEIRPLVFGANVKMYGVPDLPVEYSGAAPGQVAGVVQINVKLPDTLPPPPSGYPANVAILNVETFGVSFHQAPVTVYVK